MARSNGLWKDIIIAVPCGFALGAMLCLVVWAPIEFATDLFGDGAWPLGALLSLLLLFFLGTVGLYYLIVRGEAKKAEADVMRRTLYYYSVEDGYR